MMFFMGIQEASRTDWRMLTVTCEGKTPKRLLCEEDTMYFTEEETYQDGKDGNGRLKLFDKIHTGIDQTTW